MSFRVFTYCVTSYYLKTLSYHFLSKGILLCLMSLCCIISHDVVLYHIVSYWNVLNCNIQCGFVWYRIVSNIILHSCALWSGGRGVCSGAGGADDWRRPSQLRKIVVAFLLFLWQEYNFLSDMILPHFCRPFSTESMNMEMRQTQDVTAYVQRRLQVPTLHFWKLIWGESDNFSGRI